MRGLGVLCLIFPCICVSFRTLHPRTLDLGLCCVRVAGWPWYDFLLPYSHCQELPCPLLERSPYVWPLHRSTAQEKERKAPCQEADLADGVCVTRVL